MRAPLFVAMQGFAVAGCSAYGFADRPAPHVTERAVAVRTVDVDASAGADAGLLTRELVEELRRTGLAGARWSADEDPWAVVCDVAMQEQTFSDHTQVVASARCAVAGVVVTTRTAHAQLVTGPEDRIRSRARTFEIAALRAIEAAAVDVASHVTLAEDAP